MASVVHLIARKAWSEQGKSNAMSLCVLITSSLCPVACHGPLHRHTVQRYVLAANIVG